MPARHSVMSQGAMTSWLPRSRCNQDSASAPPTLPNVARKDWRNRSCNWSVRTCMATDPLAQASGMGGECVIVGAAGVPGVLG